MPTKASWFLRYTTRLLVMISEHEEAEDTYYCRKLWKATKGAGGKEGRKERRAEGGKRGRKTQLNVDRTIANLSNYF